MPGLADRAQRRDPDDAAADRPGPGPVDRDDRWGAACRRLGDGLGDDRSLPSDGTPQREVEQGIPGPALRHRRRPAGRRDQPLRVGRLGKLRRRRRNIVKYGLGITAAINLLLVGQNLPYNHLIGAYDARRDSAPPSFPRVTDDFQFLSSSTIAKVDAGPSNQVLAGTGLGLLHAYDGITGPTSRASRR